MADKEVYTVQHRVHSVIPYPAHCRGALYPSNDWQGFGELEVFKKPTKRASIKCDWSPLNFEILSWKGQSQDSGLRNYYLELNSPPPSQNVFLETFLAKTSLKEFAYRDRKQLVLHQNIQKLFCSIHDKISVLKRKFPKENSIFSFDDTWIYYRSLLIFQRGWLQLKKSCLNMTIWWSSPPEMQSTWNSGETTWLRTGIR